MRRTTTVVILALAILLNPAFNSASSSDTVWELVGTASVTCPRLEDLKKFITTGQTTQEQRCSTMRNVKVSMGKPIERIKSPKGEFFCLIETSNEFRERVFAAVLLQKKSELCGENS